MRKKILIGFVLAILAIILIYICGPTPDYPMYDLKPKELKVQLKDLDAHVAEQESKIKGIRPDNEARIEWYGDSIHRTEYALVYIHGFSASQMEGDPVHRSFAQRYGMNMYLPRIYGHGIDKDAFKNLTPKDMIESAKEAIAIGGLLGEKVILMSCSTGGTYSIMLAQDDPRVEALIMYSPNIGVKDPTASLITKPWGKQLMTNIIGSQYFMPQQYDAEKQKYWYQYYHTDGLLALQALIDDGMNDETFEAFDKPVLVVAYYKDEEHQDQVVSVDRMKDFMEQISTPSAQKEYYEYPQGGEHVFISKIGRNDFDVLLDETYRYAEDVLKLNPKYNLKKQKNE